METVIRNYIVQTTSQKKLVSNKKSIKKAAPRFELGNRGFAIHGLTAWLCRLNYLL